MFKENIYILILKLIIYPLNLYILLPYLDLNDYLKIVYYLIKLSLPYSLFSQF